MGKHQREKARSKRAAFKAPSQPLPSTAHLRSSILPSSLSSLSSSPSSSPHHVDLLRIAFLEWLLPLKALTSPHELWDRFMADWSSIPGHELPVQSSRPATLFSHVRALRNSNNMGAMRKEVREGRAKISRGAGEDEGGLRPHQTLLQWYLDGGDGGKEKVETALEAGDTQQSSETEAEQADQIEDSKGRVSQVAVEGGGQGERGKRKRADREVGGEEEVDGPTSGKRREVAIKQQQAERVAVSVAAPPLSLTTNNNMWAALVDG